MKDWLRKTWFFGLGLVDFTREKVESLVEDMVKRGEVNQQESPQAVEDILASAYEAQKAFFEKVRGVIGQAVAEMKLARAADLMALEKRVVALEQEIRAHQGK